MAIRKECQKRTDVKKKKQFERKRNR